MMQAGWWAPQSSVLTAPQEDSHAFFSPSLRLRPFSVHRDGVGARERERETRKGMCVPRTLPAVVAAGGFCVWRRLQIYSIEFPSFLFNSINLSSRYETIFSTRDELKPERERERGILTHHRCCFVGKIPVRIGSGRKFSSSEKISFEWMNFWSGESRGSHGISRLEAWIGLF